MSILTRLLQKIYRTGVLILDKSNVRVSFSIYGEKFEPNHITEMLGITPTITHIKGEKIENRKVLRPDTVWELDTGYIESLDINEQLDIILTKLEKKTDKLIEVKNKFSVKMLFMIIVYIENEEVPAMYFERKILGFVNEIEAEIGFDVYVVTPD